MRLLVQRVTSASVSVDGEVVGAIDRGALVLLGFHSGDTTAMCDRAAERLVNMRLWESDGRPWALSLAGDSELGVLVVSQFTLAADTRKGTRASFSTCMPSREAEGMCQHFCDAVQDLRGSPVATGVFGADMQVASVNDGPVTFALDY